MVFSSLVFLFAYLVITLLIYYITPRKFRNLFLFAINLVFYGWGEPVYLLLMLFSILINYAAGLLVGRWREAEQAIREEEEAFEKKGFFKRVFILLSRIIRNGFSRGGSK